MTRSSRRVGASSNSVPFMRMRPVAVGGRPIPLSNMARLPVAVAAGRLSLRFMRVPGPGLQTASEGLTPGAARRSEGLRRRGDTRTVGAAQRLGSRPGRCTCVRLPYGFGRDRHFPFGSGVVSETSPACGDGIS